ncbi:hypothetical protein ANME2D_00381 [Candidatus Methanoperedens nitroreducens]|uniref:Uncharacterized protein n=1 Tax=Candidatus Methanoperedens nitratireducens TaxID=1392998 RepID=A0A062VDK1_9EURY|nr:hypothetical protein [Candidatus Methanoperedens nitroreducens]KCZ73315.1 hypothetical protein ANME2D_00381 [Candidatus Methanoperedens nitroreducens]MDJ1422736.1 hypothetical protein [Candidatus Methanoperedens sp.]
MSDQHFISNTELIQLSVERKIDNVFATASIEYRHRHYQIKALVSDGVWVVPIACGSTGEAVQIVGGD